MPCPAIDPFPVGAMTAIRYESNNRVKPWSGGSATTPCERTKPKPLRWRSQSPADWNAEGAGGKARGAELEAGRRQSRS